MSDLRDLYQEMIIEHSKHPRNFGKPGESNDFLRGEGYNPLCGDQITLYVRLSEGRVKEARFEGSGCAISTASSSLMTESILGKTLSDVEALFKKFHDLVTGESACEDLGKLCVFEGVKEFPARVKCASLPWHTLRLTVEGKGSVATTE